MMCIETRVINNNRHSEYHLDLDKQNKSNCLTLIVYPLGTHAYFYRDQHLVTGWNMWLTYWKMEVSPNCNLGDLGIFIKEILGIDSMQPIFLIRYISVLLVLVNMQKWCLVFHKVYIYHFMQIEEAVLL